MENIRSFPRRFKMSRWGSLRSIARAEIWDMTAGRQPVAFFPRMEKRFMWFTGEQGMGNGRITALA